MEEKINNNAYEIQLSNGIEISKTFNMTDIYPYYRNMKPLTRCQTQKSSLQVEGTTAGLR